MFKKKLVKTLRIVINDLEDENKNLKELLKIEKGKNEIYQKDIVIILQNGQQQRQKIQDLENNIEFLCNNLSAQKKNQIRRG